MTLIYLENTEYTALDNAKEMILLRKLLELRRALIMPFVYDIKVVFPC